MSDPLSITVALPLARAYADLGLASYNKIAQAFEEAQQCRAGLPEEVTIEAIAAAMLLSFAAELYLKILGFQRNGKYPRRVHDFLALVENLPPQVRTEVKARYEQQVANKINLLKFRYEFAVHSSPPEPISPEVIQGPVPPDDWEGHVFEEAIALASPLFVKLRYLHEKMTDGFTTEIDFRWLIFLVDALQMTIYSYKDGNLKITYNTPSSTKQPLKVPWYGPLSKAVPVLKCKESNVQGDTCRTARLGFTFASI